MQQTPLITELRNALASPNVQAFLRVIRHGEGTADEDGWRRMFAGRLVADLKDHPRTPVTATLGGRPITSTAAGAYQFLTKTWSECQAALWLPDFSPASQNLAAAFLIRRRGALADVLAGRISAAIEKCNREWASLPGSPYGQPTITLGKALSLYAQHGGQLEGVTPPPAASVVGPAPVPAPPPPPPAPRPAPLPPPPEEMMPAPAPPPPPAPAPATTSTPTTAAPAPQESAPMMPVVAALLPMLASKIPELAGLLINGSGLDPKKEAAARLAVDVVTQAVGARNAQEAAELVAGSSSAAQAARDAVQGRWFEIQASSEEAIGAARQLMAQRDQATEVRTVLGRLSFHELLSLYLITICAVGAGWVLGWSDLSSEVKTAVVTLMIIGGYSGVRDFWFGSSHGSKTKDGRGGV